LLLTIKFNPPSGTSTLRFALFRSFYNSVLCTRTASLNQFIKRIALYTWLHL